MMTCARAATTSVLVAVLLLLGACQPAPPSFGPTDAQLAALRRCEAGGRYDAVSASGRYRGAYQFDRRTWTTVGGAGDPAAAAPAEQDHRARVLHSQRGWDPWPRCGRRARLA